MTIISSLRFLYILVGYGLLCGVTSLVWPFVAKNFSQRNDGERWRSTRPGASSQSLLCKSLILCIFPCLNIKGVIKSFVPRFAKSNYGFQENCKKNPDIDTKILQFDSKLTQLFDDSLFLLISKQTIDIIRSCPFYEKKKFKTRCFPIKHNQSVHITEVPGACPSSIVEFSTLSQYVSLSFQPKLLAEGWVGVLVGSYYQPGNVSQGKRNKEASLCHTILVKRDDYYFRTNISKIYTPCSCYTVQTVINGPPDPSHDNSLLISSKEACIS